jgi:hypothetical protein
VFERKKKLWKVKVTLPTQTDKNSVWVCGFNSNARRAVVVSREIFDLAKREKKSLIAKFV